MSVRHQASWGAFPARVAAARSEKAKLEVSRAIACYRSALDSVDRLSPPSDTARSVREQATALVHEAYVRLVGGAELRWDSSGHFFAAAAEAMRRILIDQIRHKRSTKHGGQRQRVEIDGDALLAPPDKPIDDLLVLGKMLRKVAQNSTRERNVAGLDDDPGSFCESIHDRQQ